MKKLTDKELKNSSILDFTDNLEEIRTVLQDDTFELKEAERWTAKDKMFSLLGYADFKGDKAFKKRLDKLFENELAATFNE